MGDWVRYKLDQQTDHILVDEAQDTNERQWNIVRALAVEYFAGEGASDRHRTIFTVGDYKQAIFGFQGTDPASFDVARAWFAREAARDRARLPRPFDRPQLPLVAADPRGRSTGCSTISATRRSACRAGPIRTRAIIPDRPGSVTLWLPFTDESGGDEEAGEEGWISDTVRRYAARLARQVKAWLDRPFHLESRGRPLRPEDILILVRRRGELAVAAGRAAPCRGRAGGRRRPAAALGAARRPGPARRRPLRGPAARRSQPRQPARLALVRLEPGRAPCGRGGAQGRALAASAPASGDAGRDAGGPAGDPRHGRLRDAAHSSSRPSCPGRSTAGASCSSGSAPEARDPIEELLSSALEFESEGAASLQGFLDWFARGDVEIVRDPSGAARTRSG